MRAKLVVSCAMSAVCAALTAFAVSENEIDYAAFAIGETPCGVMLSVYDGLESRGFSWQVSNTVETTEVQLLKGSYGSADAATFASEGRKLPAYIKTGNVGNLGMDQGANGYKAFVTGLEPGATYSYRIVATYDGGAREACAYGSFAVKTAKPETVTVVNINDVQTRDGSLYYKAANACAAAATTAGGADQIDFVLQGGDFFHMKGEKMTNVGVHSNSLNNTRWAMAAETVTPHFPAVPWVNVGGNHDDCAYVFVASEAFALTNSPHAQGTTYVGGHSFTRGNVHFTTLPFNLMFDGKNYSADGMYEWLENDLKASLADTNVRWRVVALHFGPYTTGDHAVSKDFGYTETEAASNLIVRLTPMFAANRIDLVLQAHDHTYSKTVPYRWSGRGYTTSETDAATLNLSPTTETESGLTYDVDPKGTYYVSAGCVGRRVGENVNYAKVGTTSSYTHRNLKVATGKVKVTSSVSAAGDNASLSVNKQMFGILKAAGDRLVYSFYIVPADGVETSELYDYVAIRKTAASDEPVTPYVEPEGEGEGQGEGEDEGEGQGEGEGGGQEQEPVVPVKKVEKIVGPRPIAPDEFPTEYPEGVKTVKELIDALTEAKAGDVVYVEPGTYDLTGVQMEPESSSASSAKKSHIILKKTIAIVGTTNDASAVVLKGDNTSHRVLMFNLDGSTLTLSNLTFTCGKPGEIGGGVYLYDGKARCVNCRFVANRGTYGGGFGVRQSKARDCVFRRCAFIDNMAGTGGGLYLYQMGSTVDCTFEGNVATSQGGGASGGAHTNAVFRYNGCAPTSSPESCGGGGLAAGTAAVATLFVGNTNDVTKSHGAAAYNVTRLEGCVIRQSRAQSNSVVANSATVSDSLFEENKGPAVVRAAASLMTVSGCTFRSNDCLQVEGKAAYRHSVYNCLFEDNSPSGYLVSYANCYNCTFVGNACGSSCAPMNANETAVNCVLSGNTPQDIYASNYPTMTNCVFVTRSGSKELEKAVDCKQVADVKFADPANGNYLPKNYKSPLYNAGYEDNDYLAAVGATDCAGGARRMFGRLDVGAFELQKRPGLQVLVK